jgi:hypothetical protein
MNIINYDYQGPLLRNIGRYYINHDKKAQMLTFSCSGFEVCIYGTKLEASFIATECGKRDGEGAIGLLLIMIIILKRSRCFRQARCRVCLSRKLAFCFPSHQSI